MICSIHPAYTLTLNFWCHVVILYSKIGSLRRTGNFMFYWRLIASRIWIFVFFDFISPFILGIFCSFLSRFLFLFVVFCYLFCVLLSPFIYFFALFSLSFWTHFFAFLSRFFVPFLSTFFYAFFCYTFLSRIFLWSVICQFFVAFFSFVWPFLSFFWHFLFLFLPTFCCCFSVAFLRHFILVLVVIFYFDFHEKGRLKYLLFNLPIFIVLWLLFSLISFCFL